MTYNVFGGTLNLAQLNCRPIFKGAKPSARLSELRNAWTELYQIWGGQRLEPSSMLTKFVSDLIPLAPFRNAVG